MLKANQNTDRVRLWRKLKKRIIFFISIILICFFVILIKIINIQVIEGEKYYEKSQRVIRKVVPIIAPRGEVFDRSYKNRFHTNPIITNKVNLNLALIPSHFKRDNLLTKVRELEDFLQLPVNSLQKKITEQDIKKDNKIVLIRNLTPKQHTILADHYLRFVNFFVDQDLKRYYNMGSKTAHITGYIGPPFKKDILKYGIKNYQLVGKNGLELQYNSLLKGEDGEMVQIHTARGKVEEQKVFKNFYPGNNLVLTIDAEMQKVAWKAMHKKTGSVLVVKPMTGEILTLLSKPDYDPNILISTNKKLRKEHLKIMRQTRAELNRAITTKYPPASTFKPLVALASLEEERSSSQQKFYCPGKFVLKASYRGFPDTTFFCWKTHKNNDMINAIAYSCNAYFYQLGHQIGSDPIIKYARYFRLNEKSGIDLPFEIPGFIPSPIWKEKHRQQRWFDGDTVNLSVGQGFVETTLIGMVNFYSGIVTNGVIYTPHILKEVRYAENDTIKEVIQPKILNELPISKENINIIKKGLRSVVSNGTGYYAFRYIKDMQIAGKTGTVQLKSAERFDTEQHAWFVGYGPYNKNSKNTIVVGAIIEKGGSGAASAAPVAASIFSYWAKKHKAEIK